MRMREKARTTGYFHSIDPAASFAGVADQMRSLSAVVVVRRRKPPNFVRGYADNLLFAPFGQACCPRGRRNGRDHSSGCRKDHLHPHLLLLSQTALVRSLISRRKL